MLETITNTKALIVSLAILCNFGIREVYGFQTGYSQGGPCKTPRAVDPSWLSKIDPPIPGGVYIPLADAVDIDQMSRMLGGNSTSVFSGVLHGCLRKDFTTYAYTGFNNQAVFNCQLVGQNNYEFECTSKKFAAFNHHAIVTLTDYKSFAFVTRCWRNSAYGWTIYSTTPQLTNGVHRKVLKEAQRLGFRIQNALPVLQRFCNSPLS